jgi:hypothetical protein
MAVNTEHKNYKKNKDAITKVRDFIQGGDEVKSYIVTLPGQEYGSKDDKAYRQRAYYLPAISRTLDAFVGMVMSNGAKTAEVPEAMIAYVQDITNDGEPLSRFAGRVVREVLTAARGAVIVDYPDRPDAETMSKYDAEQLRLRPYAKFYKAEEIINWQTTTVDGRRMTSQLRLMETYEEPTADEWETKTGQQIRVMDIDPANGKYRVRIFRDTATKGAYAQHGATRYPKMNGANLPYVPGVVFGPSSLDVSELERPPLLEMADVAVAHLNNSAGMEWALMWCGCPTVVIAGEVPLDTDGKPLPIKIGSSGGIVLGEGGTAAMLQASADSVGAISTQMDRKEKHMAAIGARILQDGGASNISTETAMLERVGEHSVLSDISNTVGQGITDVMRMLLQWGGLNEKLADKVQVKLNTSFMPKGMTVGELTEWVKAVQAGVVPLTILYQRLKARGEIPEEMTEDEYRDALDKDADMMGLGDSLATDGAAPVDPNAPEPDPALQQQTKEEA